MVEMKKRGGEEEREDEDEDAQDAITRLILRGCDSSSDDDIDRLFLIIRASTKKRISRKKLSSPCSLPFTYPRLLEIRPLIELVRPFFNHSSKFLLVNPMFHNPPTALSVPSTDILKRQIRSCT